MSDSAKYKREARIRRHRRVRKKVLGSAERPRLAVFRSNRHVVAQLIDDRAGVTIAAASTLESDLRSSTTSNCDAAAQVGQRVAERAKQAGSRFLLAGMQPHIRDVFEISGFLSILDTAEDRHAALAQV